MCIKPPAGLEHAGGYFPSKRRFLRDLTMTILPCDSGDCGPLLALGTDVIASDTGASSLIRS